MKKALGFFFTDIITARVQPVSLKQQNKSKFILLEINQNFLFWHTGWFTSQNKYSYWDNVSLKLKNIYINWKSEMELD